MDELQNTEQSKDLKLSEQNVEDLFAAGTNVAPGVSNKDTIRFESIENIDYDVDLAFKLRGKSFNKLTEIASPLFSLALNLKKLQNLSQIESLYQRVRDEIFVVIEEVKNLGYDASTQLSFRYSLCSFIDEMVMTTSWGSQSIWAKESMLAKFHNETWGGEKFFAILQRAMLEAEQYKDLLEFQYLCLNLGFKGQYALQNDGSQKVQEIITKLHTVLREFRGEAPVSLFSDIKVEKKKYKLSRGFPLWGIWSIALLVLVIAFIIYNNNLNTYSDEVLKNIDSILEKWSVK